MTGVSKRLFYGLAGGIPIGALNRMSDIRTLLPYHHTVSDRELLHIKHLYPFKSVKQFTTDLDFLLKHYHPVSLAEMMEAEQNPVPKRKNFLLTFDDGLRETVEIIAPILQSKGVPAVFFINPGFIDNNRLFYRFKVSLLIENLNVKSLSSETIRTSFHLFGIQESSDFSHLIKSIKEIHLKDEEKLDQLAEILDFSFQDYLIQEKPHLTVSQVKELVQKGFDIGAHSWDHPYYDMISLEEQVSQTVNSADYVKSITGKANVSFSFPHNDKPVSLDFFGQISQGKGVSPFFGIQNHKRETSPPVFHRFNAERPDLSAEKQVKGILLLDFFRYIIGKQQVLRR
jgi:peptidoglycan/xylan/chitin deacetylase (PgdA/CDA1 family)